MKDIPAWISAIAAVVSAFGMFFTFWQVRLFKHQAITQFEDSINREYRELASKMPTKALLGEELIGREYDDALDDFIHYFDLCNEQIFLRSLERIRIDTWVYWRDGIKSNLNRPAFRKAWDEIKTRSTSYDELRRLEREEFRTDPFEWKR